MRSADERGHHPVRVIWLHAASLARVHPWRMTSLRSRCSYCRNRVKDLEGTTMVTTALAPSPRVSSRWFARAALAAATLALVVLIAGAGTKTIALFLVVDVESALYLFGAWLFLSRCGVVRMLGTIIAID